MSPLHNVWPLSMQVARMISRYGPDPLASVNPTWFRIPAAIPTAPQMTAISLRTFLPLPYTLLMLSYAVCSLPMKTLNYTV